MAKHSDLCYESDEATSRRMSCVRPARTGPECLVEAALVQLGLSFERNAYRLVGRPDFVLAEQQLALFVHGCYWHRHAGCKRSSTPRRNSELWQSKFQATVLRDSESRSSLEAQGWRTCVLWECEIRSTSNHKELVSRAVRGSNR